MAMEIKGNLPDYMVRKQNYSSYFAQSMAERSRANSTKKRAAGETSETTNNSKAKSTEE